MKMQKLIVHGRNSCPDCARLKTWMERRKIEYEYRSDLTKDQIAPQIYIRTKDSDTKKWTMLMGLEECLEWLRIKCKYK
jgi:glutaredoxin-related protein